MRGTAYICAECGMVFDECDEYKQGYDYWGSHFTRGISVCPYCRSESVDEVNEAFTGSAECVDDRAGDFTVGEIYEFDRGKVINDEGCAETFSIYDLTGFEIRHAI